MYDFIKERLSEMGKTQKDLAVALGIQTPHLSALFSGIRQIQSKEVAPLAAFLKLDAGSLAQYIAGKIPLEQLLSTPVSSIFKVGYVQAGAFNEAAQLPESEWQSVPYPINDDYKAAHLFALGVRGDSMDKIFPPNLTTLICCPLADYSKVNKDDDINGKYVIVYRKSRDGLYEATVKKYAKTDEDTVMLFAESNNEAFKYPIVLHPDNNEYEISAVVISYIRNC